MKTFTSYQFAFCAAAFIICLTCLVFTFIMGRTDKIRNRLYIAMVSVVGFNSLTEALCGILIPRVQESDSAFSVLKVLQMAYFLTHVTLPVLLIFYVMYLGGRSMKGKLIQNAILFSTMAIVELLIITNPLTGWFFFYTDRVFTRNWAETVFYVVSAFYMLYFMMSVLHMWRAITVKRRSALLYFFLIAVTGIIVQALNVNMKVELLAEALGFLGVMLSIEDEEDMMDPDMDVQNRKALRYDLTAYISSRRPFHVICLKITNTDVIQRVTNTISTLNLAESVADFLKTLTSRHNIYHTSPDTFMILLMDKTETEADDVAVAISKRFDSGWLLYDKEIFVTSVVMLAQMRRDVFTEQDVFYMADSQAPNTGTNMLLRSGDLDYLIKRAAIENAVNVGLEKHNFEVYYQPTYYLDGLKLHGAEALIRLHDDELGLMYPDDFIPVAEELNHIDEIDDFVLREVCDFIRSGIPAEKGIETINVNLSVLECMRPGFVEHIVNIVDSYGIDRKSVAFEITESVPAKDYEMLSHVISDLKAEGFMIAMDDYGTGYSNMVSIFSLDFNLVKIDKSILWGAEKTELGKVILENSVRMVKQMNKKILMEGVETAAQIQMLKEHEVDYLQGYFFSKPVPKSEFLEVINR